MVSTSNSAPLWLHVVLRKPSVLLPTLLVLCAGCGWRSWVLPFPRSAGNEASLVEPGDLADRAAHDSRRVESGSAAPPATAHLSDLPRSSEAAAIEQLLRVEVVECDRTGQPLRDEQGRQRLVEVLGWQWEEQTPGPYHWTHAGLQRWLALPARQRPPLSAALKSRNPALAATADIGLARTEGARHTQRLLDVIHPFDAAGEEGRRVHDPAIRRAAIETLASLDDPRVPALLDGLFAEYAVYDANDRFSQYSAELHVELLRAIARRTSPARDERVLAALEHELSEIRTEAVRLVAADRSVPLPQAVIELINGGAPAMRMAAVEGLGKRGAEDAVPLLATAAYDQDLGIRLAAIEALGRTGGDAAAEELRTLLRQGKTRIQETAVAALAAVGDWESVHQAAGHEDWRVRRAAAEALAEDPRGGAMTAAEALVHDSSGDVQMRLVAALDRWPIENAGPILITACGSIHPPVRHEAMEALNRRWPRSEELHREFERSSGQSNPEARETLAVAAGRRQQLLDQLRTAWRSEFGELPHTAGDNRPSPPPAQTTAFDSRATNSRAPAAGLGSPLPAVRHQALESLAEIGNRSPLPEPTLAQLAQLAARETDVSNWALLLAAVSGAEGESVDQVLYHALRQPSPEIPITGCGLLARRGAPRHAARLTPLLESSSSAVVIAALDALGYCAPIDDTQPFERLLQDPNHLLRVEAALTLAKMGYSVGTEALERLLFDNDLATRRRAVFAVGELRDPQFLGLLVAQLDPRNDFSIRRAALTSLPEVIGEDVAAADPAGDAGGADDARSSFEWKEARWRQWYLSGGRS